MNLPSFHLLSESNLSSKQSCAATLANHPEKFQVTLLEKNSVVGGQATSIPLDEGKFGASWMNNGVQGGSQVFSLLLLYLLSYIPICVSYM
jgi:phytoene dehydrogenase-like protein